MSFEQASKNFFVVKLIILHRKNNKNITFFLWSHTCENFTYKKFPMKWVDRELIPNATSSWGSIIIQWHKKVVSQPSFNLRLFWSYSIVSTYHCSRFLLQSSLWSRLSFLLSSTFKLPSKAQFKKKTWSLHILCNVTQLQKADLEINLSLLQN